MTKPVLPLPSAILTRSIALLEELCGMSSASGNTAGLRAVANRLATELNRHGLAVTIADELDADKASQPTLIARRPTTGATHLLVVGHMDTVLDAAQPRRDGDRLQATGALDMKGGLVTLVGALDFLAARGEAWPTDLTLVVVPDEEVEGAISERAVHHYSTAARAILVLEPGEARGDGETLVAGRRGLAEWRLSVTGRASHSGLAYWEGRSALAAAAEWAARAEALSQPGGATVNVARLIGGDTDFVDNLALHHDLFGTPRRRNVVAERAEAEGEVRFLTTDDHERILVALERLAAEIAATHRVDASFSRGMNVPPVDPHGPGAALVERAVRLAADRGWNLEIETDRGGISFPNYVVDPTLVPIVDGLGPVGDGMHTRDEFVDLRSLGRRIALLADLLATL